jgi:hypothetical protein
MSRDRDLSLMSRDLSLMSRYLSLMSRDRKGAVVVVALV